MRTRRCGQAPGDLREYALEIRQDLAILKAHDMNSAAREVCGPVAIPRLGGFVIVRSTVELDGKARRRAVEVENVRPHAVLASELLTRDPTALKLSPEACFGWRQRCAQVASERLQLGAVVDSLSWLPHAQRMRAAVAHDVSFSPPRMRSRGTRTG